MIRRIFTPLIVALAVIVACSSNGGFVARPALADVPFISVTGTLTNVGDAVTITNLVGQSTCSFFISGTTGAMDVQGTNDRSTSPAWTTLAVLDYASPPNVQSQPFSPNVGQAYQFSPTSLTRARVTADSSWSGGPATVTISCSGSVARAGSGGGGGTVTGTEPITVTANNVGFDYGYAGTFSVTQSFQNGFPSLCSSLPQAGTLWGNGSAAGYAYMSANQLIFGTIKNNLNTSSCQNDLLMAFTETGPRSNTPSNVAFYGLSGYGIEFPNFDPGCLYVQSGSLFTTGDGSTCGGSYTAGTNINIASNTVSTIAQPAFTNVDLTDTSLQHPGTYAGLAADGSGQVKFVSLSPQPCPSTGCGVLGVAATEPLSSTGGTIPNISINSPIPVAYGGLGQNASAWSSGDCVLTTGGGFTPAPCPATSIPPYPSPSPAPSFTATTPLGSSSSGNVVTTFIASPIPAAYGGLGTNASTYTTGDCPVFNGTIFVAGTCGGGTYTAGTNISIASNVVSVVSDPVFTGTTQVYNSGSSAGTFIVGGANACSGSSVGICEQQSSNAAGIYITVRVPPTTFYQCGIAPSTTTVALLNFSTGCTTAFGPITATSVSSPSVADSSLTSGKGVCATTSGALFNCNGGQFSCTISSGTACSTTTTVTSSTEICNATYDHATTVAQGQLAPAEVGIASTTLTMYAATTSTASGTVYFDVTCT